MDNMTYILFDNDDPNNRFIDDLFDKVIVSPHKDRLIISWILGAVQALKISSKGDKIVCWYDFQAIILFWISVLTFRKRQIICLNILLKPKKSLKNKFVTYLYKIAFSSKRFYATVTSMKYGELINKMLQKDYKFYLLHDVYHDFYDIKYTGKVEHHTVFCGGRNGRDWDFMIKLAKEMPDVYFNIVVPQNVYEANIKWIPQNIRLKTNLIYRNFLIEMCKSEIVCLPLNTEAPAGLIVLFQSAANNKFIITTDTVTTSEYINASRGLAIPNEISHWKDAIELAFNNTSEVEKKVKEMKAFMINQCDEISFRNSLKNILLKL